MCLIVQPDELTSYREIQHQYRWSPEYGMTAGFEPEGDIVQV